MTEAMVTELARMTVSVIGLLSAPILIVIVVTGILVNVIQAITQIRDPSLAFVPKVVLVGIVLVLFLPWKLQVLREYTVTVFSLISQAGL